MRYLSSVLLAVALLSPSAFGASREVTRVFNGVTVAPSGTSEYVLEVAQRNVFGVSWTHSTTEAANGSLALTYSNAFTGPFTSCLSQISETYSTSVTIATTNGATDLNVPPMAFIKLLYTNSAATTATFTADAFHQ